MYVDPKGLSPLLAYHSVSLDQNPGIRSISICETVRRIIAKVVLSITHHDVFEAAGSLQPCVGQPFGVEAAINAVRSHFEDDSFDCVLMVDASNAFNFLNQKTAMHNILYLCPSLAKMIINCYRQATNLMVSGNLLLPEEGTMQGDPLTMPFYALATIPLLRELSEKSSARQV